MTGKYKIRRLPFLVVNDHPQDYHPQKLDTPELVEDFFRKFISTAATYDPMREQLIVIPLTTRLNPMGWHVVAIGTLTETVGAPREVFRPLIVVGAHTFLMLHNHPSGDPSPSSCDRELTKRIRESGEILCIKLMDHLIMGTKSPDRASYYSFREGGLL